MGECGWIARDKIEVIVNVVKVGLEGEGRQPAAGGGKIELSWCDFSKKKV